MTAIGVIRSTSTYSFWFSPNPRAAGREGKGPIHLEDAPPHAPHALLVPLCYFLPHGLGAALGI